MVRLLVYLLMMINMASSTGWWYLIMHNLNLKHNKHAVTCMTFFAYFIITAFVQFDAYVIHELPVHWDLFSMRWVLGVLGLYGTFRFAFFANFYIPKHDRENRG